jgi:hypothetical protein
VDESADSSGWGKTIDKLEHSVGDFNQHVAALLEQESSDWNN